jgi:hypothetical protein
MNHFVLPRICPRQPFFWPLFARSSHQNKTLEKQIKSGQFFGPRAKKYDSITLWCMVLQIPNQLHFFPKSEIFHTADVKNLRSM